VTTKAVRQPAPIRAFLVDDSELVLKLVPLCLALERVKIVGTAKSAEEAFPEIAVLRPDLIIADIRLPGIDGISLAMEVRGEDPDTRIILISVDKVRESLPPRRKCADAFVAKADLADELASTIRLLFPKVFSR